MKIITRTRGNKSQLQAFTLIELIVVIAIVSILASMAVPNLFSLIDRSKVAADMQNVAVLNSATNIYAVSNNLGSPDIFNGLDSDNDRINELVNVGFLAVVPDPVQSGVQYIWDIDIQKWILSDSDSGEQIDGPDDTPPAEPTYIPPSAYPLWESGKAYAGGTYIAYDGKVFRAHYYASENQVPGVLYNPWQEITDEWRNFNVYLSGDTVKFNGNTFNSRNWSQNQQPGLISSPWQQQTDSWTNFNVYNANDEVWHNSKKYQAKWYSQNENPQSSNAWRLIG